MAKRVVFKFDERSLEPIQRLKKQGRYWMTMSGEHPDMSGSGCDGPDLDECETCEGKGELENDFGHLVSCPDCQGLGFIQPDDSVFDDDVM